MKNRRTKEGYKLRTYIDALQAAKSMTTEEWVIAWAKAAPSDSQYICHVQWISYLEQCIIQEASNILKVAA